MHKLLSLLVLLGVSPCFGAARSPAEMEKLSHRQLELDNTANPPRVERFSLNTAESADLGGLALAVLVPMHHSGRPFWDDLVHTLNAGAARIQEVHVVFLFRTDDGPDQVAQSMGLLQVCLAKHPLLNVRIYQNESNLGWGLTRRLLLGDLGKLIQTDSPLMAAASQNRLYYTFMDNDDAVHSCLYRIMLQTAICTEADIVNGEYLNQMFNIFTIDRIQHFEGDISVSTMSYVSQMPERVIKLPTQAIDGEPGHPEAEALQPEPEDACKLNYDENDKRIFADATGSTGYAPVLFRYTAKIVEGIVPPEGFRLGDIDIFAAAGDTMHYFIDRHSDCKMIALIPDSETPSMYFYRQHSGSALHDLEVEFSVNYILGNISEFFEIADKPNGIQFLLGFDPSNIIPHLGKVKALLSEARLAEYVAHLDQIIQQICNEEVRLRAELEGKRSTATTPWQLGLSWTEE